MPYDYYHEPSEFEIKLDELKESLMESVKEEHIQEIKRLRDENRMLQGIKEKMKRMEMEHRNKLHELDRAKGDALNIVRRERLSKLLEPLYVNVYRPTSYREESPKCDKCDESRYIKFLSPSGNEMSEKCSCAGGKLKYKVETNVCVEFRSSDGRFSAWYQPYLENEECDTMVDSTRMEKLHDDISFEEIERTWRAYFISESKCQEYCDWLNAREVKQ